MNLLKLNAFRGSIFKQAKFLISSPPKSQKCVYISEAGNVSMEILPINTGFVQADTVKKAWLVLHPLKCQILKDGQPYQDEAVLSISDRSYYPLDPQKKMKQSERNKNIELKSIAKMKHAQARTDMEKGSDPQAHLAQTIVTNSFILLALIGLFALALNTCGG